MEILNLNMYILLLGIPLRTIHDGSICFKYFLLNIFLEYLSIVPFKNILPAGVDSTIMSHFKFQPS